MNAYWTLDFLVPFIIGVTCLVFAARIPFADRAAPPQDEPLDAADHTTTEPIATPALPFADRNSESLGEDKKSVYMCLFGGLGLASILFAFGSLFPVFSLVAKGVIVLAILATILISRRAPQPENNKQPDN